MLDSTMRYGQLANLNLGKRAHIYVRFTSFASGSTFNLIENCRANPVHLQSEEVLGGFLVRVVGVLDHTVFV